MPTAEQFQYLLQPALILASVSTAIIARLTRTTMLEAMSADHVRTARAKGLKESQVLPASTRCATRCIPVVTFIGIDFGTLVGAAILTETVFNWPGPRLEDRPGRRRSVTCRWCSGCRSWSSSIYGVASLLVDLSYGVPRSAHPSGRAAK